MIVVSDTSPLNYLLLINRIDVLPQLFSQIYAPEEVLNEMLRSRAPDSVKAWAQAPPPWLQVAVPSLTLTTSVQLDPGEIQAIALAKELAADAVLIDERKGRRVAREQGLNVVGTLGVLEFAAEQELLALRPALEALQQTTFYVTPEYIAEALQRERTRRGD